MDLRTRPAGARPSHPNRNVRLCRLLREAAAGDPDTFAEIYSALAIGVWRTVNQMITDPAPAAAAFESTFVEALHRAGFFDPAHDTVDDWIRAMAVQRASDRLRAGDDGDPGTIGTEYDAHVHRELLRLLGRPSGTRPACARVPGGPDVPGTHRCPDSPAGRGPARVPRLVTRPAPG